MTINDDLIEKALTNIIPPYKDFIKYLLRKVFEMIAFKPGDDIHRLKYGLNCVNIRVSESMFGFVAFQQEKDRSLNINFNRKLLDETIRETISMEDFSDYSLTLYASKYFFISDLIQELWRAWVVCSLELTWGGCYTPDFMQYVKKSIKSLTLMFRLIPAMKCVGSNVDIARQLVSAVSGRGIESPTMSELLGFRVGVTMEPGLPCYTDKTSTWCDTNANRECGVGDETFNTAWAVVDLGDKAYRINYWTNNTLAHLRFFFSMEEWLYDGISNGQISEYDAVVMSQLMRIVVGHKATGASRGYNVSVSFIKECLKRFKRFFNSIDKYIKLGSWSDLGISPECHTIARESIALIKADLPDKVLLSGLLNFLPKKPSCSEFKACLGGSPLPVNPASNVSNGPVGNGGFLALANLTRPISPGAGNFSASASVIPGLKSSAGQHFSSLKGLHLFLVAFILFRSSGLLSAVANGAVNVVCRPAKLLSLFSGRSKKPPLPDLFPSNNLKGVNH